MNYILIYFILANGNGFVEPQKITRADMSCGRAGNIIGVQINRLVNPSEVRWADPDIKDAHCIVDISNRITTLIPGQYHIATTIFTDGTGKLFNEHNPHTSIDFTVVKGSAIKAPAKPGKVRLKGQE